MTDVSVKTMYPSMENYAIIYPYRVHIQRIR